MLIFYYFSTDASKERLLEALSINKSLSALSNVLTILADPAGHSHVPYRSNVLTRCMEDSLGNNVCHAHANLGLWKNLFTGM